MKSLGNSWHIDEYRRNILRSAGHIEWKYFNFSAEKFSGVFVYFVADPLNISGIGGARVIGRIYANGKAYGGVSYFDADEISASKKSAEIRIGGENSIKVAGGAYRIRGKSGRVSWDLRYLPLTAPVSGFSGADLDFLGLEKMSWRIQMPRARVSGSVNIGKKLFRVRSLGYTDANWGDIMPLTSKFNWAQCIDGDLSVVAAEVENFEIGRRKIGRLAKVFLNLGKQKIVFPQDGIYINYDKWETIPNTRINAPTARFVSADNGSHLLFLEIKASYSDPMQLKMPLSFPVRPTTVEQPSVFSGGLFSKKGAKLLRSINGRGFMEYTLRNIDLTGKRPRPGILV
jgi:hypothetical protein